MKTKLIVLGIISLLFILVMCEKESSTGSKEINFLKIVPGGCNLDKSGNLKNTNIDEKDTATFTIVNNDTLDVFIGLNYTCCAPFTSETGISNDSILINITDTCPLTSTSCYCKCMCYYTWNCLFDNLDRKKYYFKIVLNDPREENPIIFKEGILDLSKI